MQMKPSDIHYTQATIYERFGGGHHKGCLVRDTLQQVLNRRLSVNSFPVIQVIEKYGKVWSVDNRRLWIFKEAEKKGICTQVNVKMISCCQDWRKRFTTQNGGKSIEFRRTKAGMRCEFCHEHVTTPDQLYIHKQMAKHLVTCSRCGNKFECPADLEEHKYKSCRNKENLSGTPGIQVPYRRNSNLSLNKKRQYIRQELGKHLELEERMNREKQEQQKLKEQEEKLREEAYRLRMHKEQQLRQMTRSLVYPDIHKKNSLEIGRIELLRQGQETMEMKRNQGAQACKQNQEQKIEEDEERMGKAKIIHEQKSPRQTRSSGIHTFHDYSYQEKLALDLRRSYVLNQDQEIIERERKLRLQEWRLRQQQKSVEEKEKIEKAEEKKIIHVSPSFYHSIEKRDKGLEIERIEILVPQKEETVYMRSKLRVQPWKPQQQKKAEEEEEQMRKEVSQQRMQKEQLPRNINSCYISNQEQEMKERKPELRLHDEKLQQQQKKFEKMKKRTILSAIMAWFRKKYRKMCCFHD